MKDISFQRVRIFFPLIYTNSEGHHRIDHHGERMVCTLRLTSFWAWHWDLTKGSITRWAPLCGWISIRTPQAPHGRGEIEWWSGFCLWIRKVSGTSTRLIRSSLNQYRRICPGRHFAEWALWAAVASILSTVRISKAKDSQGKEIPVSPDYITGVSMWVVCYRCFRLGLTPFSDSRPKPFAYAITSINSRRGELMNAASLLE
jgi:hypothetical protein